MKTIGTIGILSLLLGLATTASAQDDCHRHDRERGECSPGTEAPTQEALMNAIQNGSAQSLAGTLEYGERVDCYECVPALVRRVMTDGNARVREYGAWWLRRRHLAMGQIFTDFRDTLRGSYPSWVQSLMDEHGISESTMRARAAEALGELLDPHALSPLTEAAMTDTEAVVRTAAVTALGRLNHPGGNAVLAAALSDESAEVRRAVVMAIPRVNFFREHDALLGTLADEDVQVRRQGALLLGQMRVGDAVDALAGLLRSDPEASVRRSAAWALGRIGTGAAREALNEVQASESVSMVRDAIEVALRM